MERSKQSIYEFGRFALDTARHILLRDQQPVALTPKTYDTLRVLVENSGRMLSKTELMQALWPDSFVEESNLTVQISAIRKVLGADQPYIVTIPGRGYRFDAQVSERRSGGASPAIPRSIDGANRVTGNDDASRDELRTTGSLALHAVPRDQVAPLHSRRSLTWAAGIGLGMVVVLLFVLFRPHLQAPSVLRYEQITNTGRVDPGSTILTDGTRVYFVAHPIGSNAQRLYQASVDGKEISEVPIPFDRFFLCDISPDHSQLLIATAPEDPFDHPLWIMSVLGGSPRRVGNVSVEDATWTREGKRILFSSRTDVFLAGADGSSMQKLFTTPGFAVGFHWSPSGHTLRFTVIDRTSGLEALWEAQADGSHLHPLLPKWNDGHTEAGDGSWTPDGRYFLFRSIRGGRNDIWAIREKADFLHRISSEPTQLSTGPTQLTRATLGPDGKSLFVVSEQNKADLFRYEEGSHALVPYLQGLSAHRLVYSHDGQWVAYTTYPDGELWCSKTDGSERVRLTFSPIQADLPRWSPDGSRIVFVGKQGGQPGTISLIPARGGEPKRLLPDGVPGDDPDWSPDGTSIVFGPQATFSTVPVAGGQTGDPASSIRTLELSSGQIRELPDSGGLYWPRWSPRGDSIAALSIDTHRLLSFDLKSRKWTTLASGKTLHNPLWSHNGAQIYFQDLGEAEQPIYRVGLIDGKTQRVVGSEMISGNDAIYTAFTGLTSEDAPVLMTIRTINDIYRIELKLP
jgi:Tol biopolymer transport system component/DNA-binding winged helix-turn-helix (wHTH) protein